MARQLRHLELQAWEPKSAGTLQEELNSTCCEIQLVEKELKKARPMVFKLAIAPARLFNSQRMSS
jgi:hypothetical protein